MNNEIQKREEELDKLIDYDIFVRMKPIARYKIEFSKIIVKKGKPKIINEYRIG